MIIYPAIDLRGGKVVRLREGDPSRQTTFSDDPIATAQMWLEQGATWLHMVNLDGAFNTKNDNQAILQAVAQLPLQIQFGGGLRDRDTIQQALDMGAARVVIGTAAVENPQLVEETVERFGADAICVALDARDGKIATHGWQTVSDATPIGFGKAMAARGVRHALYTDVKRDGGLQGVNIDDTVKLAEATGLDVIASGGVSQIEEIATLAKSGVVAGAIIGMALYEKKLTLPAALAAAEGSPNAR